MRRNHWRPSVRSTRSTPSEGIKPQRHPAHGGCVHPAFWPRWGPHDHSRRNKKHGEHDCWRKNVVGQRILRCFHDISLMVRDRTDQSDPSHRSGSSAHLYRVETVCSGGLLPHLDDWKGTGLHRPCLCYGHPVHIESPGWCPDGGYDQGFPPLPRRGGGLDPRSTISKLLIDESFSACLNESLKELFGDPVIRIGDGRVTSETSSLICESGGQMSHPYKIYLSSISCMNVLKLDARLRALLAHVPPKHNFMLILRGHVVDHTAMEYLHHFRQYCFWAGYNCVIVGNEYFVPHSSHALAYRVNQAPETVV